MIYVNVKPPTALQQPPCKQLSQPHLHDSGFHALEAVGNDGGSAVCEQSAGFNAAARSERRSCVSQFARISFNLFIMPLVEETAFLLALTTQTRATSSGQWDSGATLHDV